MVIDFCQETHKQSLEKMVTMESKGLLILSPVGCEKTVETCHWLTMDTSSKAHLLGSLQVHVKTTHQRLRVYPNQIDLLEALHEYLGLVHKSSGNSSRYST